ncbi:butyryl-CoA dehydrogenase [alpha proteobacterium U9-1i]|nr:butyryl-CoA dehydrogenase [alpha proteobacterium U9-1i]
MFDHADPDLAGFREEAVAWIKANFPSALTGKSPTPFITDGALADSDPDYQAWLKRVVSKGWGAPTWPEEYGGGGLTQAHSVIIHEELARVGAFHPNHTYGEMMLGPTLLEYGDEVQKRRFIPPIARAEVRWCQGFSEPGAGSDLASLQTKCVDGGDHWIVTGQKIWTSGANHSHWCFCLVRTDTTTKHGGISFLLIDMSSPGIEARPIYLISGSTHFCEVFFNDVKVPKENMVGGLNKGWPIAKRLLQFERDSLASGRAEAPSLAPLAKQYLGVNALGQIADPDVRHRVVRNAMRARAYAHTMRRAALEAKTNAGVSAAVSALKNLGSDIAQERADLAVEILGHNGLGWEGDHFAAAEIEATRAWLHSRAFSIYGGSLEIQNNITAKRVLGLPG